MITSNPVDDLALWWRQSQQRKMIELYEILGISRESFYSWRKRARIPVKYIANVEALGFMIDPQVRKPRDFYYCTRFDESVTLEEIARELGVSRERARQLTIAAMVSFEKELHKRGIKMEDLFGP